MIAPAILCTTKANLSKKLKIISKVKRAQVDIMDGKFVKNKTVQPTDFKNIKSKVKLEFQLMVKDPVQYSQQLLKYFKPYMIIFHVESFTHKEDIASFIYHLKRHKIKAGIALNPRTNISRVKPFLKLVDLILVMTVQPGFSGQKFIKSTLKKISALRKITKKDIEVDGGINFSTLPLVKKAGANIFVMNTALFKGSFSQNLKKAKTF